MRDRLIFVARHLFVPAQAGAPIRSLRLLSGLAEEFACTLVHLDRSGGPAPAADELAAALGDVERVPVPVRAPPRRVAQLLSVPGRRSAAFGREATRALARAVRVQAARPDVRIVHFDDVTAGLAGPAPGVLNAFAPHNVEHRIIEDTARHTTGVRRAFAKLDAPKLRREEEGLWRAMDLCVAVSELDAATMRRGGARRVVVCPNGTDPAPRRPVPARRAGEPLRLLFVGAGSYEPNRLGLRFFFDEVLPLLGELDVRVDVVGTRPGTLAVPAGVTLHGKVPSVDPFYARAHAAIVPLHVGSGTRLKVVEAMVRGLPVIATGLGAEGLPVRAGVHYRRADDAAAFAAALVELAHDLAERPAPVEVRLAAARAAVEHLLWPRIAAELAATYRAALTGTAASAAVTAETIRSTR